MRHVPSWRANTQFCRLCSQTQFVLGKPVQDSQDAQEEDHSYCSVIVFEHEVKQSAGWPWADLESPLSLCPTSLKFKWLHRTASASYQDGQRAGQFTSLKNNLIFLVELIRIPLPDSKLTDIKWIISSDFSALWDETSPLGSSSLCRSILQEICSDLTVLLMQEPVSTGQTLHFNSKYACVIFPRTCFRL